MKNNLECSNVPVGTVVIVNYEANGKTFSEEAVLVDNYTIDKLVPRIEVGCVRGSYKEEELFVFETPKTKRFILTKDEFIDYEKNIYKLYKKMNYHKIEIGKRVKILGGIYGAPELKDVKFGTIGILTGIYQNTGEIKMASVVITEKKNKKQVEREVHVPLVNCIAIGK